MNKEIQVRLHDILDAIRNAGQFSFDRAMFFYYMALMLQGRLKEEDINNYIKTMVDPYDDDDRQKAKDLLIDFKESYIDGAYKEPE